MSNIILILSEDDWDLLYETLKMDTQSRSFSATLRERIGEALERIQEIDLRNNADHIVLRRCDKHQTWNDFCEACQTERDATREGK